MILETFLQSLRCLVGGGNDMIRCFVDSFFRIENGGAEKSSEKYMDD